MRLLVFSLILVANGVSAEEVCRPTMAQAMQRAMDRCQTTIVGPCPKAIQLTAMVIAEGKAQTAAEIYDAVGEKYQPNRSYPKSNMLEGMTLLLSELGMLEKPAVSK